ncbi:hypothetical protein F444_07113 [Phytophthora nicotianae P1976]|nr:hypothetical protein F444_07113 [Phytophthora nicotianae P1976]
MPRRLSWEEKAVDVDAPAADALLETLKSFDIVKSQTMACTLCASDDHKMRYRLLACASVVCIDATTDNCGWRGKIVTCLETGHASIFEYDTHSSTVSSPRRKKLSSTQKTYCRELADNHLRPMRIRHALARKFSTSLEDLPPLKTVQNFVNNYGRNCLENHDRVDDLRAWTTSRNIRSTLCANRYELFGDTASNLQRWLDEPALVAFAKYIYAQWLTGSFATWQVFATPPGFASKNNPVETFNALLKRDYTLRRRLKMGSLLRELSACCQDQSSSVRAFEFGVCPSKTLARRVSELVRAGAYPVLRIISLPAPRIVVDPNKRSEEGIAVSAQMEANYARKEVENEPWGGWEVDVERQWCPCDYCFAFGTCVPILFALRVTAHVDSSGRDILVSRRERKRVSAATVAISGHPGAAGPALSL